MYQTKECMVAKLFAKHIKLTEAIETVSKSRIGIGVGTPQRIIDLLEDGTFCLRSCLDLLWLLRDDRVLTFGQVR